MSPLSRPRALALSIVVLLVAGITVAAAATQDSGQGRDPWYRPFASNSIWNMPIGSDAKYADSGYPVYTRGGSDYAIIEKASSSDPKRDVHAPYNWRDRCNTASTKVTGSVVIPNDLTVEDAYQNSNGGWRTPNGNAVVLQPDGRSLANLATLCRDQAGGPVYGWRLGDTDLHGDGIRGSHGASAMSVMGGAIRPGELVNDKPIQHALDLVLFSKHAYIEGQNKSTCYVWPASRCDGYAGEQAGRYEGNNPAFKIGALLAIPPHVSPADIGVTTHAGRKVFEAMQNYGGYFTDDSAWEANKLVTDRAAKDDIAAFNQDAVRQEFGRIVAAAKVVVNNGPNSIGGGGTPRRPLLPEIGESGSTTTTTAAPATTTTTTAAPATTTTTAAPATTTTTAAPATTTTTAAPATTTTTAAPAPAPAPVAPSITASSTGWQRLYRTDFGTDSGAMGTEFTLQGPRFERISGLAGVPSGAGESVAHVETGQRDVVVSATITQSKDLASAGLSLRATDRDRQLLVTLNSDSSGSEIALFAVDGKYRKLATSTKVALKQGSTHTLRAEVVGGRIAVTVDGVSVISHELSSGDRATFNGTKHGLRTYRSSKADDGGSRWHELVIESPKAVVGGDATAAPTEKTAEPVEETEPAAPATETSPVRFADDFNSGDFHGRWKFNGGSSFSIRNRQVAAVSRAGEGIATVDLGTADVDLTADIKMSRYRAASGLTVRAADRGNQLLVGTTRNSRTDRVALYIVQNGRYRRLASVDKAGLQRGGTHEVRIQAVGSSVTVWVDGVQLIEHTLSASNMKALAGNTAHGIRTYRSSKGEDGGSRWDNVVMR